MSGFAKRMGPAQEHERNVIDRLTLFTWSAEPFGQGQLATVTRNRLRDLQTPLRWLPDIIATRRAVAVLVDAKTGRTDTPNYSVEQSAVSADVQFEEVFELPVFYVWGDWGVLTPQTVLAKGRQWTGLYDGGRGSGTPFYLVAKACAMSFEDTFVYAAVGW